MNPNPQRNSNPVLCYALVGFGFLIMFGAILLAAYLKPRIVEAVSEPFDPTGISEFGKIEYLNRQITAKDQSIEFEKRVPDMQDFERRKEEARKKLNDLKTGGNAPVEANLSAPTGAENKADKIKRLEDEKTKLIAERDDFAGKMRAKQMRSRTFGEWLEDYSIGLLVFPVIPLGLFSLYLLRFVIGKRLPARNPLSLTDAERMCVLFVPFSIVFSAFGFFLFVWILDVTN